MSHLPIFVYLYRLSLAFSRGHNKRVDFIMPVSSGCDESLKQNWPTFARQINSSGRSYIVGVLFEDFIDLTRDMLRKNQAE